MPVRAVPGAVQRKGRTDPAGSAPVRLPPARQNPEHAGPSSLKGRLARAERLGHRIGVTASRPQEVQRKVGFELELQVLLTSGAPLEKPEAGEFPWTREDLKTAKRRPKVKETRHTVMLEDGSVFEWRDDSQAEEGENAIRPEDVQVGEPGRWIFKREAQGNEYFDPLLKKEESLHDDGLLRVVEDHAPEALVEGSGLQSIPEFVTVPKDEFGSSEEFLKPIRQAQLLTQEILSNTKQLKTRVPASAVFSKARRDLYLGYDKDDLSQSSILESQDTNKQSARAAVQATYAVQSSSIPGLLAYFASTPRTQAKEGQVFASALKAAGLALHKLSGLLKEPDTGLAGLVHILCLYLTGGHEEFIGSLGANIKNYAPLLNRAALNTYVGEGGFLGNEAKILLSQNRQGLIDILLFANGRGAGEPVISGFKGAPQVGEWLEEVLSGKGDSLRSYDRFGRAKQIPHEDVGPEGETTRAPVFEERQVPAPELDKLRPDLVPVEQWDVMAAQYQKMLQSLNSPGKGKSGSSQSSKGEQELSILPPLNSIVSGQLGSQPKEEAPPKQGDTVRCTPKKGQEQPAEGVVLLVKPGVIVIKPEKGKNLLIKEEDYTTEVLIRG